MRAAQDTREYRPDIDGLRAIAVLAVMVFHANDSILPGGFIGVDVFFVISGYLISKQIAADTARGSFSLLEFYRRRIRRIAPMMMVIVTATLLMSYLLMTPEDARNVAKSAVWSVASAANVYFWRELDTGYFANSSAEVPLLHLWSLGVEEQFYLVWPLLLTVGLRALSLRGVLCTAVPLAIGSFALASLIAPGDPSFAYYMLPTRMGELLLGALVGIASAIRKPHVPTMVARTAAVVGGLLVSVSLFLIDRNDPFPGWLALPPTLGATLVIVAGEAQAQPIRVLASRALVAIGRISYSAYLWHWPLFALFRYAYGEPDAIVSSTLLALTLVLSWVSFNYVERPTRRSTAAFRYVALRQFLLPAGAVLLSALLIVYAQKLTIPLWPSNYLVELERTRDVTRAAFTYEWICQRQRVSAEDLADRRCVVGSGGHGAPRTLIWGDSNAAHYVPMVREIAVEAGTQVRNIAVGSCPPLLMDAEAYVEARRLSDCRESAAVILKELDKYPLVVLSAAWSSYAVRDGNFLRDVAKTVHSLRELGHTVVVIGRAPVLASYDRRCLEKALRVPFKSCPNTAERLSDEVVRVNDWLRRLAESTPGVRYFDGNRWLCPDGWCGLQTANGLPRYFDSSHLTVAGAIELGREIVEDVGVPEAFSGLLEPTTNPTKISGGPLVSDCGRLAAGC